MKTQTRPRRPKVIFQKHELIPNRLYEICDGEHQGVIGYTTEGWFIAINRFGTHFPVWKEIPEYSFKKYYGEVIINEDWV